MQKPGAKSNHRLQLRGPALVDNAQEPTGEHQLFHRFQNVLKRASRMRPGVPEPVQSPDE
jgi:hypothetical protein